MRLNFIFLLVFLGLNSCSEQEARAPITSSKSNGLLSTISVLKEINKADTSRIGMFGWSRGGMMTYLALQKSDKINFVNSFCMQFNNFWNLYF